MSGFYVPDWLSCDDLGLTNSEMLPFALILSYTIAGAMMFESHESLAHKIRLSRKQTSAILKGLCEKGLVIKSDRKHSGGQTFDYVTNLNKLSSIADSSSNEKFRQAVKKLLIKVGNNYASRCDNTSQQDGKKLRTKVVKNFTSTCEEISHNNINDNNMDNKTYKLLSSPSKDNVKILVFPIFFFKNNCDPHKESERFYDYYSGKSWTLNGGMVLDTDGKIMEAAKNWREKYLIETPFPPMFINFWKHLYGNVPYQEIKQQMVLIERLSSIPSRCFSFKVSNELGQWLKSLDPIILQNSAKATLPRNFKLEWVSAEGRGEIILNNH